MSLGGEDEGLARNELVQLCNKLEGNDPDDRKVAAKRIISRLRAGENVQSAFAAMLRCVRTDDLELKKQVYLYLLSYSSQEPEQAIMAVNTFIRDCEDSNPLVRALAVRTMCRIKLETVAEHMIIPLKKTLRDGDPYVRKTAAFGVPKLYEVIPEAVENADLFADLLELLRDENPMVVSNATAAIFEVNEARETPIFEINGETVGPILAATNGCTEWCHVILLDALSRYKPESEDDAGFLIERLMPFLKHTNPAVVIASFKCIFLFIGCTKTKATTVFPQVLPSFITLVSAAEPEIQYVALRTLGLFVQKYPKTLAKEIRVFFCKYNDPCYVKMEKLDIIIRICKPRRAQLVVDELCEYCNSVDVAFVRKSVQCIGQIALKIPEATRRCVDVLVGIISGKADYAIEEAVCVICDILRKSPGQFDSILITVCQHFERLKDPRAKAAGIWLVGEYANVIENADVILDPFLDTFRDEQPPVQLAILSAFVKVFCAKPEIASDQLQFVFEAAMKPGTPPDVKNRALIYWRTLSTSVDVAKDMLSFDKTTTMHSGVYFATDVLKELIRNVGNVSGVLHIVPSDFVRRAKYVPEDIDVESDGEATRVWHALRMAQNDFVDLFADYERGRIHLKIVNRSYDRLSAFAFALNKNAVGIVIDGVPAFPAYLESGDSAEVAVPVTVDATKVDNLEQGQLQIAFKTDKGNVFATDHIPAHITTLPDGRITRDQFGQCFRTYTSRISIRIDDATMANDSQLSLVNVFVLGVNGPKTYVSFMLPGSPVFVGELSQIDRNIEATIMGSSGHLFKVIEDSAFSLFAQ